MLEKIKIISIAYMCLLLTDCTANYQITRHEYQRLSKTDSYYIALPENGRYGTINYPNSGAATRDILFSGFVSRGIPAMLGTKTQKNDALVDAQTQHFNRLVYPVILHWEDRATEWSGLRDRAKINIEVIDIETGETLDSTLLDLTGTWWTFGGLHPQNLVEEASVDYFEELFGD